jgi:thiol-disulfide isomerase/thioredoxin|tara:strand:+ start:270 stop:644 length:375 start_codon:yes stop_codon:yes gene_type:complete
MFKKFLILFFVLFSFQSFAIEKKTTFTLEAFNEAQKTGKTIVINSWNKFCGTCARQTKILNEAQKDFPDVIFLSYEQTKHKDIAKLLNVDYWATIIVYKNSKEVAKEIGVTNKSDIYSLIKKEI